MLKKELTKNDVPYKEVDTDTVDGLVEYHLVCDELNVFISTLPLMVVKKNEVKTCYIGQAGLGYLLSKVKY